MKEQSCLKKGVKGSTKGQAGKAFAYHILMK